MTNFTVRRLAAGDLANYRTMMALFAQVFGDDGGAEYSDAVPPDAYVAERLADPTLILLVAECEGAMIGALAAYALKKFEQARSEIYIYDLAVHADFRRQGVATTLIDALRPIARSLGAWTIIVQADPPDTPAIMLYEGLGTREEILHFNIAPG